MGNKTTIQVAKWLIVVGILCPILTYCIENFIYQEIPGLIGSFLLTIGWFLLLASAKDKHWRFASCILSICMLQAFICAFINFMRYQACFDSDDIPNAIEQYSASAGILNLGSGIFYLILCAVAFSALSFGRTQRYKNSVAFGLIATLLPFLILIFNVTLKIFQDPDIELWNNLTLIFRLNWFVCALIEAFAIGRMITFYERGEGTSELPLQMKGIFTSRYFCATILFLLFYVYLSLPNLRLSLIR